MAAQAAKDRTREEGAREGGEKGKERKKEPERGSPGRMMARYGMSRNETGVV